MKRILHFTFAAAMLSTTIPVQAQNFNQNMVREAINEVGRTWRFVELNADGQNIRFIGTRAKDYLEELGYYNTSYLVDSFATVGQIFEGQGLRLSNGVYLQGDVKNVNEVYLRIVVHF